MRPSVPIPRRIFSMSAPTCSQYSDRSFMNEIFTARKALAAYFVTSALFSSNTRIGAPVCTNGSYTSRSTSAAYWLEVPTTTRSGFMKSSTANPSRKNSGLLTTSTRRVGAYSAKIDATRAAVPTGTVLLLITIRGSVMSSSFRS